MEAIICPCSPQGTPAVLPPHGGAVLCRGPRPWAGLGPPRGAHLRPRPRRRHGRRFHSAFPKLCAKSTPPSPLAFVAFVGGGAPPRLPCCEYGPGRQERSMAGRESLGERFLQLLAIALLRSCANHLSNCGNCSFRRRICCNCVIVSTRQMIEK